MSRETGFPLAVRVQIIERAQGKCELCGKARPGMACHHRRPRQAGGSRRKDTNLPSNGLYLCGMGGCHDLVESNRLWAYERGLLLKQNQHPSKEPVWLFQGRVLLSDDGAVLEVTN